MIGLGDAGIGIGGTMISIGGAMMTLCGAVIGLGDGWILVALCQALMVLLLML